MTTNNNSSDNQLKVFISTSKESECDECNKKLMRHSMILLAENSRALCLKCAGLDHLVFLPSGNVAMTRRSKKYSSLSAVVLKWSRQRRRYERQGLLVKKSAIIKAEKECEADADIRKKRQKKAAIRNEKLDKIYIKEFSTRIRELFPSCPQGRERSIAEHACRKYSGRVGRSSNAKQLNKKEVTLAVIAHIRHTETNYDELFSGMGKSEKSEVRKAVSDKVNKILTKWQTKA